MATPAIRALHDHLQPEKMVAVSKAYVAPILDGNPWFNETILTGGKKRIKHLAGCHGPEKTFH